MKTLVAFARYFDEVTSHSIPKVWPGTVEGYEVDITALPIARTMLKHAYHATSVGGLSEYCLSNLAMKFSRLKRGNIELKVTK